MSSNSFTCVSALRRTCPICTRHTFGSLRHSACMIFVSNFSCDDILLAWNVCLQAGGTSQECHTQPQQQT